MLVPIAVSTAGLAPFLAFGFGFALAALGHLFRVRLAVVAGLVLMFAGVVVFPTLLWLSL